MSAHASSFPLPLDPQARRRLWQQWITQDKPRGETVRHAQVARVQSDWLDAVIDQPTAIIDGLMAAIGESLVNGQLSWSDRQRLITRAIRLGLSRFEANLLIAAVQHREAAEPAPRVTVRKPQTRWSVASLIAAAVAAEAVAIGAIVYWLR